MGHSLGWSGAALADEQQLRVAAEDDVAATRAETNRRKGEWDTVGEPSCWWGDVLRVLFVVVGGNLIPPARFFKSFAMC